MTTKGRLQESILLSITGDKGYHIIRNQVERDSVKRLCTKYYNVDIARIGEDEFAFLIERGEELADMIVDKKRSHLTTKERQDIRRLRRKARKFAEREEPAEEEVEQSIVPF
jgi:GGDEF domain-containing protein